MNAHHNDSITVEYESRIDALYIKLRAFETVDGTKEDGSYLLDHIGEEIVGIEILSPPTVLSLSRLAAKWGFAHDLDDIYRAASMARGVQTCPPGRSGATSVSVRRST